MQKAVFLVCPLGLLRRTVAACNAMAAALDTFRDSICPFIRQFGQLVAMFLNIVAHAIRRQNDVSSSAGKVYHTHMVRSSPPGTAFVNAPPVRAANACLRDHRSRKSRSENRADIADLLPGRESAMAGCHH
jgi:hypothetical protein